MIEFHTISPYDKAEVLLVMPTQIMTNYLLILVVKD